jgi:hypothetical protein
VGTAEDAEIITVEDEEATDHQVIVQNDRAAMEVEATVEADMVSSNMAVNSRHPAMQ